MSNLRNKQKKIKGFEKKKTQGSLKLLREDFLTQRVATLIITLKQL